MHTGENEQGLRKILDMTRLISIALLALHFYHYCYAAFEEWGLTYLNGAVEQLEGQIASAKLAMARLSSPQLYYVLSGNDFTLDINNPEQSNIVCMGNNPPKISIYRAVLSLYVT